jgi:hypothetical protein
MTEGRQPFTAEIKTLAKGPSIHDIQSLATKVHASVDSGPPSVKVLSTVDLDV